MSARGVFVAIILAIACSLAGHPCLADETSATPSDATMSQHTTASTPGEPVEVCPPLLSPDAGMSVDDTRSSLQYETDISGDENRMYTLEADRISAGTIILAEGDVIFVAPDGTLRAQRMQYNRGNRTGAFECVSGYFQYNITQNTCSPGCNPTRILPLYFAAQELRLASDGEKRITDVRLTTCREANPHFHFSAHDVVINPDNSFVVNRPAFNLGGRRYRLPIRSIKGNFGSGEADVTGPSLMAGLSSADGLYVEENYFDYIGNSDSTIDAAVRVGTAGEIRTIAVLGTPFGIGQTPLHGKVRLVMSSNELVQNRMLIAKAVGDPDLDDLTIDRLPGVDVKFDQLCLLRPLQGWNLQTGGGVGRYSENPTDVTANRAQAWGILGTPQICLGGKVNAFGEFGVRHATYGNDDDYTVSVLQLTLERTPHPDYYYNITYLQRRTSGETPFIFDRVVIPDELYTEVEFPLVRNNHWYLNLRDQFDLDAGSVRAYRATLIYRLDCVGFGAYYDSGSDSFGVGFSVNGFNDFRHGTSRLGFTQ